MALGRIQRILSLLGQNPAYVARRVSKELRIEIGRFCESRRAEALTEEELLKRTSSSSFESLWSRLANTPYVSQLLRNPSATFRSAFPAECSQILEAAEVALTRRVDLLGSGLVDLGTEIDWHKDYKTGSRWQPDYAQRMRYVDLSLCRDVKFPWELSRMQWVLCVAQAYYLTGDERFARFVREVLESWLQANPQGVGVNWACTMEVALRMISWTFFFHACGNSKAWEEKSFRFNFLRSLYLHADFTERFIEESAVNGNHFTAGAAGLVFAGLFFVQGREPKRWGEVGWKFLSREVVLQTGDDGLNIEASTAYHRLVLELFLLPALYRKVHGEKVEEGYRDLLLKMSRTVAVYTGHDGSAPIWGDADNGRALPLGIQGINDHRSVVGISGAAFQDADLISAFRGLPGEPAWLLGTDVAAVLASPAVPSLPSRLFASAGVAVLRNDRDHVFVDCGPVGFRGMGGHGHNDCLSLEAELDGLRLITDCGSYVYTSSAKDRNLFRSTAYHNTPQVDGQEINRIDTQGNLWRLANDAEPRVVEWNPGPECDLLCAYHTGYSRLQSPAFPVRSISLNHRLHALGISDSVMCTTGHDVEIPIHLVSGVEVQEASARDCMLTLDGKSYLLLWNGSAGWELTQERGRMSPTYGVLKQIPVLRWKVRKAVGAWLTVGIMRIGNGQTKEAFAAWLDSSSREHRTRAEALSLVEKQGSVATA